MLVRRLHIDSGEILRQIRQSPIAGEMQPSDVGRPRVAGRQTFDNGEGASAAVAKLKGKYFRQ